jgi:hypothetical protein
MQPHINYYRHALAQLAQQRTPLPDICTVMDLVVICDLPYAWLAHHLANDALPGTCFGGVSHWRCRQQTVVEWLKEHAHEEHTPMAGTQRRHPPHHLPAFPDYD